MQVGLGFRVCRPQTSQTAHKGHTCTGLPTSRAKTNGCWPKFRDALSPRLQQSDTALLRAATKAEALAKTSPHVREHGQHESAAKDLSPASMARLHSHLWSPQKRCASWEPSDHSQLYAVYLCIPMVGQRGSVVTPLKANPRSLPFFLHERGSPHGPVRKAQHVVIGAHN